jgi:hypothetical protein
MSVVTALACLAALDDERAVCDALAEAVAGYMLTYWYDQEQPEYAAMRAALDAYHAHREVWP